MILLTVEEIATLHSKLIDKTGGTEGIRDIGLLESAVYSAQSSFDEVETYPTIEEKAARLMYSIANNHAFVDGNKRIAVLVMLMTLELNGVVLMYEHKQMIDLGLSVASGLTNYSEILEFINTHKK